MSRRHPTAAARLAKVLALLGSPHDGDDEPPTGHRELAAWLLRRLPELRARATAGRAA